MHHVWLGRKIPKQLTECMRTCYEKHPTWKHKLWTYHHVPTEIVMFREEYKMFDKNVGRRSDLLRLEILYRYGGLYLDTDVECVKPVDELLKNYDFVMGSECSHIKRGDVFDSTKCDQAHINNAVIASTPHNPILLEIINEVKENYKNT